MPFISETASAIKSRFGFHSRSSSSDSLPVVRSPPDLSLKSAATENPPGSSQAAKSAVRSIGNWDEDVTPSTGSSSQSFEISEDPSFWKDHNVQVIIRVRPLSNSEISLHGNSKCIRQDSCQTITWTGHPESRFTFDLVADENVSQEKMFNVAGLPMVENCMGGYNSCMFAYGQTGSGKTHTMLGDIEAGTRRHSVNCGMTPRVFECLFSRIQKEKEVRKDEKLRYTCKCSFLEIYNEQILDLLDPSSNNLQIREDTRKGVYVENLKEIEVTSARDVLQQLIQGAANRKVAATNMNRASSRSHSVFTCIIESKWESQGVTHHRFARLNLVDLAGSERQKSSGAEGERLKEATNINKSLSTLGLVIMNLVNVSNGKSQHVPYRDSKLTFLLQDSLGGNSKTIIIANISPSSCCSLETLGTLKFAQRAKFIKNNAIVNEDASGDVIAMRMQIQHLKKEVARLQVMVNGGAEGHDYETSTVSLPGSPGIFKWEGLPGFCSPLNSDKRISQQRKDYELALVGAFRREKEKETILQALTSENQAAVQLAKERENEIQNLKMRLRFREAGIKRLEAVASGKISAETHLLKEKEEYLKEIEVLRAQVDRNQEVTRFAMENLRLKEEIRRLKSFCEEGEREKMTEQIIVLENKLLEALDWKLMHEAVSSTVQANPNVSTEVCGDVDLLSSGQERLWPLRSTINEENEFLRMQAIHNQSEIETLQKQLQFCIEEKEKLESEVNSLVKKLEVQISSEGKNEETQQIEHPTLSDRVPCINLDDQMELKTMVDAIATASQREAEAHQMAIMLSKKNDELRLKLETLNDENNELNKLNEELQSKQKVLVEEKSKLIELYEKAAAESNSQNSSKVEVAEESRVVPNDIELNYEIENLKHQLMEMHEENDKLLGLYEKAMQERDEFKRMVCFSGHIRAENRNEFDCPEKLVEIDGCNQAPFHVEDQIMDFETEPTEPSNIAGLKVTCLVSVREKLNQAQDKLSDSATTVTLLGSIEKSFADIDNLSRNIEVMEESIKVKQQQLDSLKLLCSETQERKSLVDNKLLALKYSVSSFSSSVAYFEQREARAKGRVISSLSYVNQRKEELLLLQASKSENEVALRRVQQSEAELRNKIAFLKSKLEEENRRQENERVLFAIDNVEQIDQLQKNCHLVGGKATELLKSEEEKIKLQNEIKSSREKLGVVKREFEDLTKKSWKIDSEMQTIQMEIQKSSRSIEEMELALKGVVQEKDTLLAVRDNGKIEIDSMIIDYQQCTFEADLKEAEMEILEEEVESQLRRVKELQALKAAATHKTNQVLVQTRGNSCFLSEKMEGELRSILEYVVEARTLLRIEHENDS